MLGNFYWVEFGVLIFVYVDVVYEIEECGNQILNVMKWYNCDKVEGIIVVLLIQIFEDKQVIEMGDFCIEVFYFGLVYGLGDMQVWLLEQSLVIVGDMVFYEWMLLIFEDMIVVDWLDIWEMGFEVLNVIYVILGYGYLMIMVQVCCYICDYLFYLCEKIGEYLENGGDLVEVYYVDQLFYVYFDMFEELVIWNVGWVYEQMEFEQFVF